MLSYIKLYAWALFAVFAINEPPFAQTPAQSGNIPIPSVIELAVQSDEFSEIKPAHSTQAGLDRTQPIEFLLTQIATWLSETFDLPLATDRPRVEFASRMKLATMRYRGVLPEERQENSPAHSMQPEPGDVIALYYDPTRTIYLSTDWTGANPADLSVLVHEMVHHLQNLAGLKFECRAAREKLAYLAQDQWLQLHGSSLEKEFEIDKFTVMVKSACWP